MPTKKSIRELANDPSDRFIWKEGELELVSPGDGPVLYSFNKDSSKLTTTLSSIYEEIMWLVRRPTPGITAGRARGWYTHIMAESLKRQIRRFTGLVSEQAVNNQTKDLRLEHFLRIQNRLTDLVKRHREGEINDPGEFIQVVIECECVHIVTSKENYEAMRAKGDYAKASILLVSWASIPEERRAELWRQMLKGRVANANDYAP